jgi:hypothetical protein
MSGPVICVSLDDIFTLCIKAERRLRCSSTQRLVKEIANRERASADMRVVSEGNVSAGGARLEQR